MAVALQKPLWCFYSLFPSSWEIIRRRKSYFSTTTPAKGSSHSMLWGKSGTVFPAFSLPIPNSSAASTQDYPGSETADSLKLLLLSVSCYFSTLAYTVLLLTLSVAAGITIGAGWRESEGRQDGLTDDYWKLGSGVNHGKKECIWEWRIRQIAEHSDTFHDLCQN